MPTQDTLRERIRIEIFEIIENYDGLAEVMLENVMAAIARTPEAELAPNFFESVKDYSFAFSVTGNSDYRDLCAALKSAQEPRE